MQISIFQCNNFFKAVFFLLVTLIFFQGPDLSATTMGGSDYYHGMGVSGSYAKDFSGGTPNDGGVDLSYRNGFFAILSLFITADAGYRFNEKSIETKAGLQAMILFFGLETGVCYKSVNGPYENIPGGYMGIVAILPYDKTLLYSLSAGVNLLSKGENELYFKGTAIFNFFD